MAKTLHYGSIIWLGIAALAVCAVSHPVRATETRFTGALTLKQLITQISIERGLPPEIVHGVIQNESNYNARANGDSGRSKGLMQVQYRWHKEDCGLSKPEDLFDSRTNVNCGIGYLKKCWQLFGKDMLKCYNAGPDRNKFTLPSVKQYEKKVLTFARNFRN